MVTSLIPYGLMESIYSYSSGLLHWDFGKLYACPIAGGALQWRHNGRDCVSNQQPRDCLLKRLFRLRSKKTSKLRVTGLCAGKSPGPVNSPHKWPVTRKMFPFYDVIMLNLKDIGHIIRYPTTTNTTKRYYIYIYMYIYWNRSVH